MGHATTDGQRQGLCRGAKPERVEETYGNQQRLDFVKTILSAAQDLQRQVDLGWYLDNRPACGAVG